MRKIEALMKRICVVLLYLTMVPPSGTRAAGSKRRLLAIGDEKGYRHEAVSHAMATIERLGRETGLWDTVIRTDTEALTTRKLEYNARYLNDFDARLFYTGANIKSDDAPEARCLSCLR